MISLLERFSFIRRKSLVLFAALVLVASQAIVLEHHHDGDLQPRYDCEICLKLTSGDDGIPATGIAFAGTVSASVTPASVVSKHSSTVYIPPARAPPL